MPSRFLAPSPTSSTYTSAAATRHHLLPPLAAASTCAAFSFFLFLVVCFRKISRKRTAPETASTPPHSLPYSDLRRATDSFSASRRLGQGGFGPVFRGSPIPKLIPEAAGEIAVKVMDSGSLQGEREFQNELLLAAACAESPYVVSVLGFSSDRKRRRMLLVYEFMPNGNLQDALLHRKCPELMEWKRRLAIAVDIARGLEFLHGLDEPIIHGDIKPSNILLDLCFSAKIGDFGLARLKSDGNHQIEIAVEGNGSLVAAEDCGSVVEESESVTTAFEDSNLGFEFSPISKSPEVVDKASAPASSSASATPSPEVAIPREPENGGVKDYVMKWIGTEIKTEASKSDWTKETTTTVADKKIKKKRSKKQLDWWISMDEEKTAGVKEDQRRPPREWWREEYCDELAKKKKKKMKQQQQGRYIETGGGGDWLPPEDDIYAEKRKKSKSRSRSRSRSSLDWWLEGEIRWPRRHGSHDSSAGDAPRSGGGYSSTPSMRGTVCYVAPETGLGDNPSEKCDVYSFGVTLLVLVAGRRPLQVTAGSPMSDYQRANLLSWARHLARSGKLLDLVDKNLQHVEPEQAVLCVTVALLCLQKVPARRPAMKEVVAMLAGESEPPQLPVDLSPSPQSQRFPFKTNKRVVR